MFLFSFIFFSYEKKSATFLHIPRSLILNQVVSYEPYYAHDATGSRKAEERGRRVVPSVLNVTVIIVGKE